MVIVSWKGTETQMKKEPRRWRGVMASLAAMVIFTGCGSAEDNVTQGMQAIKDLDYQAALASFELGIEKEENERLIYRGMGIAYMGLSDYEQAITCFEQALQGSNGLVESIDYDLNYYLAAAYVKNGKLDQAESCYNAILNMNEKEKDVYFLRGSLLLDLGRYEDAIADFEKVILIEPKNYSRLIQIYEVLNHAGYEDQGQEYLQVALKENENQITPYDRGRIYYYMGEYQKAYLALEEAKQKGGADAYLYLGKSYEATGDYNYAASVYNDFINKEGANAKIYNQLGLCEIAKGNYDKALQAFQVGMGVEDNEIVQTLKFNEIVAYEYLGDYTNAKLLIDQYISTYPDDETAKRENAFLQTR